MEQLVNATRNSSTHTLFALSTLPNESLIDPRSSSWPYTWRTLMFMGMTLCDSVLSFVDYYSAVWFPDARRGRANRQKLTIIDVDRVEFTSSHLLEKILANEASEELWRFANNDDVLFFPVQRTGYLSLREMRESCWQEARRLSSGARMMPPPGLEDDCFATRPIVWAVLSFFPPTTVPEGSIRTVVLTAVHAGEAPPIDLVFCWLENQQIAWGLEADQTGGEYWSKIIQVFFSETSARLTLCDVPRSGYFSSLYTVDVHGGGGPKKLEVWVTVAKHVPSSGSSSTEEIVRETHEILSLPHVREIIHNETKGSGSAKLITGIGF